MITRRSKYAARRNLLLQRIPAFTDPVSDVVEPAPEDPAEWGGLSPFLDWDPADATATLGALTALPDSSGNGRDATISLSPPGLTDSDASFNGAPSIDFAASLGLERTLGVLGPGGAYGVALVARRYAPADSNNYLLSASGDQMAVYASSGDLAFHAWGDPSFAEGVGADPATAPTVILVTNSGESAPGASDAVVKVHMRSLTPAILTGRGVPAAAPWKLGDYYGSPSSIYQFGGALGRCIVWLGDPSAQSSAILNALGTKYGISLLP